MQFLAALQALKPISSVT